MRLTPDTLAFIEAAEQGDLPAVVSAIEAGVDVNASHSGFFHSGDTALMKAVKNRSSQLVKILLDAGAHPDKPDAHGVRPLHLARDEKTAQLLIDSGADLSEILPPRFDPPASVLEVFIKAGADVNASGLLGRTTLMHCAFTHGYNMGERRRLVTALIEKGASVDARDHDGATVLQYAATTHDPELVHFIIELAKQLGVSDLDAADIWEVLRGDHRWKTKEYSTVKAKGIEFGFYDPRVDELVIAASKGRHAVMERLLDESVEINALGDIPSLKKPEFMLTGIPALDAAATYDRLNTVRWLLKRGANPNVRTTRTRDPRKPILEAMAADGRPQAVELLLAAGASADHVNLFNLFTRRAGRGRWTQRHNQCVQYLIDAGIALNKVREDDDGWETVLDAAKVVRNKQLIALLKAAGAR